MSNWWETNDASAAWGEAKEEQKEQSWDANASWDAGNSAGNSGGGDAWAASGGGGGDDQWGASGGDAAATTEPAADDAWGAQGDSWGKKDDAWGQSAPSSSPPAHDFWDTQAWNKEGNILPKKEDWELDAEEETLFNQKGRAQAGLNFSKYEQVPVDISGSKAQAIPVCKTFEEIFKEFAAFMPQALAGNLRKCAYNTPTPVQKFAIPCGLVGRDIMCCAQTGSGKTAAFLVPLIGRMMKSNDNPVGGMQVPFEGKCSPMALVMTPTRELCLQIYEEAQKCCHRTEYRVYRVYGGEKPKDQLVELCKGADLLVATPGRLTDFIGREVLAVDKVQLLVLDEADRMLDMGFEPQIRDIVENHDMAPKDGRQTMMFSATFPEKCQRLAADYLYDYVWIAVGVIGSAVDTVEQVLERVDPAKKYEKLIETLDAWYASRQSTDRMLIFTNAKATAKWLDEQLYEKKFDSGALYGDLTQQERETNLHRFRQGEIDVLIATDVASRGLDIEGVSLVVNYDMPTEIDSYIHRIGRTGRIGNEGQAISFISTDDSNCSLEAVGTLKELVGVMQNSGKALPDWLEGLIESTENSKGSWSWGGKDVREDQEQYKGSGSGDAWGSWNKSGDDSAWKEDSWEKEDPWSKKW